MLSFFMNRLGIFLEKDKALIAEISEKGKILKLKKTLKNDVKQLDKYCKKNFSAGVLPPQQVFIKNVEAQKISQRFLQKNLNLQKEIVTILPKDETAVAAKIQKISNKKAFFSFQIIKKKHLGFFLKKIDPHMAVSSQQALFRFARVFFPQNTDLLIMHFAEEETVCLKIKDKTLKAGYNIHIGINAISQKEEQSIEKLGRDKKQLLEELNQQISQTLDFFAKQEKLPLLLTGNKHLLKHIDLLISSKNKKNISSLLETETEKSIFAIPIGAALETTEKKFMQFRDLEFFPERIWKKKHKVLTAAIAFLLTLSGVIVWQGEKLLFEKKQKLLKNGALLFSPPPKTLEELNHNLFELRHQKANPFSKKPLKASYVLHWLSSHPLIPQNQVEITSFQYELVSLPKIGNLQAPYLAKIEVVFKIQNPILARKIHTALQQDPKILSKPEMVWEGSEEFYKAIFHINCNS